MTAKDVMTRDVVTAAPDMKISEVAKLLLAHNISGLPVVDGQNRLVGMVSEGDLIYQDKKLHTPAFLEILGGIVYLENPQRITKELQKMTAITVSEIMTTRVFTVKENTPIEEIATIMVEKKVNRLPVVGGDGVLIGIISRQDLVKTML